MRAQLVRSLRAVLDVDPVLDGCDAEIEAAKAAISGKGPDELPEVRKALSELEEERARYLEQASRPSVRVRVIPPAPLAYLRGKIARGSLGKSEDLVTDMLRVSREIVRWSVVGWSLLFSGEPTAFSSEDLEHEGRKYSVASWEVVDTLEAAGYLHSVAMAAWRFSVLSEDDRKK